MKDDTALYTMLPLAAMVALVAVTIISWVAIDADRDVKAINAGLQQCVVGTSRVWQKECGK